MASRSEIKSLMRHFADAPSAQRRRMPYRRGRNRRKFLAKLFKSQRKLCGICGEKMERADSSNPPTIDHIQPLSRGGKDSIRNMRAVHRRCNADRGSPVDWGAGAPRKSTRLEATGQCVECWRWVDALRQGKCEECAP